MVSKQLSPFLKPRRPLVELRVLLRWIFLTLLLAAVVILVMLGIKAWDPFGFVTEVEKVSKPIEAPPVLEVGIWEVFFSVFGMIYAIIVGLFLVEAYKRWKELSSIIHREINAVNDIHDCLKFFADKDSQNTRDKITNKLWEYVDFIEKIEWEKMKHPQEVAMTARVEAANIKNTFKNWWITQPDEYRIDRFEDEGICTIIEDVSALKLNTRSKSNDARRQHALELIMDRICEITTHRTNRLELAERGLSFSVYIIILFMSVVIEVATLLLNVPSYMLHGCIVVAVTLALIALFLLLYDMDHPFTGSWRIYPDSLEDIKEKLGHAIISSLLLHIFGRRR